MGGIIGDLTDKTLDELGIIAISGAAGKEEAQRLANANEADLSIQSFSAIPTLDPLRTSGNVQFAPFIGSANDAAPETPGANGTFLGSLFDIFASPLRSLGTPGFTPGDDPGVIPVEGIVIGDPDFEGPNAIQGPGDIRRNRNLLLGGLFLAGLAVFVVSRR